MQFMSSFLCAPLIEEKKGFISGKADKLVKHGRRIHVGKCGSGRGG